MANKNNNVSELEFMCLSYAKNANDLKGINSIQDDLKAKIIKKMDSQKLSKVRVYDTDNDNKAYSFTLCEKTKLDFNLEAVAEIAPELIKKKMIVNDDNLEAFEKLLKEFKLTGKQVNALCKVMNLEKFVDEKGFEKMYDKGEFSKKEISKMCKIISGTKYIRMS